MTYQRFSIFPHSSITNIPIKVSKLCQRLRHMSKSVPFWTCLRWVSRKSLPRLNFLLIPWLGSHPFQTPKTATKIPKPIFNTLLPTHAPPLWEGGLIIQSPRSHTLFNQIGRKYMNALPKSQKNSVDWTEYWRGRTSYPCSIPQNHAPVIGCGL